MPEKAAAADGRTLALLLLQRLQSGESLADILKSLKVDAPAVRLPGLDIDTSSAAAKMGSKGAAMDKSAEPSRLEKLDLKGVGPDMLQAIANRDVQTVLNQPIMLQRTGERLERIRRLKDELKTPGSHLKPEKPKRSPAAQAAEDMLPPTPHLPSGPGSPIAPSNLLGGFSPEQMGMLPKMSAMQLAAKQANGDEDESYSPPTPDQATSIINMIARTKGQIEDEELHEHAEDVGANPHAAEEVIYQTLGSLLGGRENDAIPGGLAAGMPNSMFPKKQLDAGTKVELEHSSNPVFAQEISKDHLVEGDDYYKPRLAKLEENMEEDVEAGKTDAVGEGLPKVEANKKRKEHDVKQLKKSAYKYGFFLKCAEVGLTPPEMEKRAFLGQLLALIGLSSADKGKDVASGALGTAKDLASLAVWAPIIAAPILGAAGGASARYLTAPGYAAPEEFRHIERLAALRKYTREAKHRAKKRQAAR